MTEDDEDKGAVNRAVAAADRSLMILEAFLDRPGPRSLIELEQRTGLFKSVILRYMISFEGRGFIRKDEDGLYRLGPKAFQLGKAFEATFDLSRVMQPVLDALTRATNESASVYIRDGDFQLCLLRSDPDRAVRVSTRAGSRLPVDEAASSLVLLRYEGKRYGDVAPLSEKDIICTRGKGDPLLASMSTPLFGPGDIFLGTLTLAGVNGHFDVRSTRFKSLLFEAAMSSSRQLGATLVVDG
ncbi:Transcriptional regulator, IclR family [Paraburkholderia piptadeniae]|uniref:Transcriptional regulator, IclR family n=1 Tax=Paraburkholderia piptadeniae TaxID=1701573 RepID=A0A1N7SPR7_9BURK|nr:helix-turn-helix domain-containing protein [Paraburkholderia piptadeniae]SIT49441.1 Transcriptional regulator, IclR family [Paraburkholderia piptadeniae]